MPQGVLKGIRDIQVNDLLTYLQSLADPTAEARATIPAKILLQGLTGPLDGRKYPGIMESMKRQDDAGIASALTYVRNGFGSSAPPVGDDDIARARAATADRTTPWTMKGFAAYQQVPQAMLQGWKWSASEGLHVEAIAAGNLNTRYTTDSRSVDSV